VFYDWFWFHILEDGWFAPQVFGVTFIPIQCRLRLRCSGDFDYRHSRSFTLRLFRFCDAFDTIHLHHHTCYDYHVIPITLRYTTTFPFYRFDLLGDSTEIPTGPTTFTFPIPHTDYRCYRLEVPFCYPTCRIHVAGPIYIRLRFVVDWFHLLMPFPTTIWRSLHSLHSPVGIPLYHSTFHSFCSVPFSLHSCCSPIPHTCWAMTDSTVRFFDSFTFVRWCLHSQISLHSTIPPPIPIPFTDYLLLLHYYVTSFWVHSYTFCDFYWTFVAFYTQFHVACYYYFVLDLLFTFCSILHYVTHATTHWVRLFYDFLQVAAFCLRSAPGCVRWMPLQISCTWNLPIGCVATVVRLLGDFLPPARVYRYWWNSITHLMRFHHVRYRYHPTTWVIPAFAHAVHIRCYRSVHHYYTFDLFDSLHYHSFDSYDHLVLPIHSDPIPGTIGYSGDHAIPSGSPFTFPQITYDYTTTHNLITFRFTLPHHLFHTVLIHSLRSLHSFQAGGWFTIVPDGRLHSPSVMIPFILPLLHSIDPILMTDSDHCCWWFVLLPEVYTFVHHCYVTNLGTFVTDLRFVTVTILPHTTTPPHDLPRFTTTRYVTVLILHSTLFWSTTVPAFTLGVRFDLPFILTCCSPFTFIHRCYGWSVFFRWCHSLITFRWFKHSFDTFATTTPQVRVHYTTVTTLLHTLLHVGGWLHCSRHDSPVDPGHSTYSSQFHVTGVLLYIPVTLFDSPIVVDDGWFAHVPTTTVPPTTPPPRFTCTGIRSTVTTLPLPLPIWVFTLRWNLPFASLFYTFPIRCSFVTGDHHDLHTIPFRFFDLRSFLPRLLFDCCIPIPIPVLIPVLIHSHGVVPFLTIDYSVGAHSWLFHSIDRFPVIPTHCWWDYLPTFPFGTFVRLTILLLFIPGPTCPFWDPAFDSTTPLHCVHVTFIRLHTCLLIHTDLRWFYIHSLPTTPRYHTFPFPVLSTIRFAILDCPFTTLIPIGREVWFRILHSDFLPGISGSFDSTLPPRYTTTTFHTIHSFVTTTLHPHLHHSIDDWLIIIQHGHLGYVPDSHSRCWRYSDLMLFIIRCWFTTFIVDVLPLRCGGVTLFVTDFWFVAIHHLRYDSRYLLLHYSDYRPYIYTVLLLMLLFWYRFDYIRWLHSDPHDSD